MQATIILPNWHRWLKLPGGQFYWQYLVHMFIGPTIDKLIATLMCIHIYFVFSLICDVAFYFASLLENVYTNSPALLLSYFLGSFCTLFSFLNNFYSVKRSRHNLFPFFLLRF